MKKFTFLCCFIATMFMSLNAQTPIAAWNFTGIGNADTPGNGRTFTATTFDANLVSSGGASDITRGAGAVWSTGANSFRTTGFRSDIPISTANTNFFQVTLTAEAGYEISLSTIDARLNGTQTFVGTAGVSNQFAYSLDGTNFTLIGSPQVLTGTVPLDMSQIDLTSIAGLQNVAAGTTITIRFYASGQTNTGGWGFFSGSGAGSTNGLAIGGTVIQTGAAPSVANPTFNPPSGFLNSPTAVAISTTTAGAEIWFTTDGSEPSANGATSTLYTAPVTVSPANPTIKAIAVDPAGVMNPSSVVTATYTFPAPVANIAEFLALGVTTPATVAQIEGAVSVVWHSRILTAVPPTGQPLTSLYVQDASGSLLIFGTQEVTFAQGDVITGVIGNRAAFAGSPQMANSILSTPVAGTPIAPVLVDTAAVRAMTVADHARFIKIYNAEFASEAVFSTTAAVNANLSNGVIIRDNFRFGGTFPAGQLHNITGFVNINNGVVQVFPIHIEMVIPETPSIVVLETSVPAMAAQIGRTATQTITVSGFNLTADITLTVTGTNLALFTVDPTSIAYATAENPTIVTITYAPIAADGPHTATLTISSPGADDVVFELSGTVLPTIPVPNVIITQVYGGGGNAGAPFTHDFVTLFNTTNSDIDITGWSLQYYSATGLTPPSTGVFVFPAGSVIRANNYALIQLATQNAAVGSPFPVSPNFIAPNNDVNMAAANGKVILFRTNTPQTITTDIASVTGNAYFQDYVPYGNAVPVWGSALGALSNTTAAQRRSDSYGYIFTKNVGNDFKIAPPAPVAGPDGPPVGIDNPTANTFQVSARNGVVSFNAETVEQVEIFNVLGQRVISQMTVVGLNEIPLNFRGVAIVRVGNQTAKVKL